MHQKVVALFDELDFNRGETENSEQIRAYYNRLITLHDRLVNMLLLNFYPELANDKLKTTKRYPGNRKLHYLLHQISNFYNKVIEVKSKLDSLAERTDIIYAEIEPIYLIDEEIITRLYKNYDGKWWKHISKKELQSCFDEADKPLVDLNNKLIDGQKNRFGFFLASLKKGGEHTLDKNSETGKIDLITTELAFRHFGIKKERYAGFKSESKERLDDDKSNKFFKEQLKGILNIT